MQEHDWSKVEADECSMGCGQTQRNGGALCGTLLRPMGKILDTSKLSAKKFAQKTLGHPVYSVM